MNKKIFIMPIAICAMGLASCNNNSWPTKTNEEAKTVAAKISAEATEMMKDPSKFKTLKVSESGNYKNTSGKTFYEGNHDDVYKYDSENAYEELCINNVSKSQSGTDVENYKKYKIFESESKYELSTQHYYGDKTPSTKDKVKEEIVNDGFEHYTKQIAGYIYSQIYDFDTFITGIESEKESYKTFGGELDYNYHFESNKEGNLKFVKTIMAKNLTKVPEEYAEYVKQINNATIKREFVIENNFVTKVYTFREVKGKDLKDLDCYLMNEANYSFEIGGTISRDSVNVNDFDFSK